MVDREALPVGPANEPLPEEAASKTMLRALAVMRQMVKTELDHFI